MLNEVSKPWSFYWNMQTKTDSTWKFLGGSQHVLFLNDDVVLTHQSRAIWGNCVRHAPVSSLSVLGSNQFPGVRFEASLQLWPYTKSHTSFPSYCLPTTATATTTTNIATATIIIIVVVVIIIIIIVVKVPLASNSSKQKKSIHQEASAPSGRSSQLCTCFGRCGGAGKKQVSNLNTR